MTKSASRSFAIRLFYVTQLTTRQRLPLRRTLPERQLLLRTFEHIAQISMSSKLYENILNATFNYSGIFRNVEKPENPQQIKETLFLTYSVFMPIVCVAGLLGNSLNITVLWRSPHLTAVSFTYLRWLAIADFCVITEWTFFLLYFHMDLHTENAFFAFWDAHLDVFLTNSLIGASALLVMVFTADRYLAVCHPFRFQQVRTKRTARTMIAAVFVLSFLLCLPLTFEYFIIEETNLVTNDTFYESFRNKEVTQSQLYSYVWPWVKETVTRMVPLLCVVVLNPLILRAHRVSLAKRRRMKTRLTSDEKTSRKEERRLLLLLFIVSAIFVVCMLPASVLTIIKYACDACLALSWYLNFRYVANVIETVNFAVNFYGYSIASSEFRKSFAQVFSCVVKNRVGPRSTEPTQTPGAPSTAAPHEEDALDNKQQQPQLP